MLMNEGHQNEQGRKRGPIWGLLPAERKLDAKPKPIEKRDRRDMPTSNTVERLATHLK